LPFQIFELSGGDSTQIIFFGQRGPDRGYQLKVRRMKALCPSDVGIDQRSKPGTFRFPEKIGFAGR
jgi:hypothetical protein